ncbi:MAG: copper amine oxidase N-terminal domain-containing protein [Clostridiales bacterium]|nr:copper amine oxidase N-terminal domain-containing protein [Clostridiales bacterium]
MVVTKAKPVIFIRGRTSYPMMQNGSLLVPVQQVAEALVYDLDQSSVQMSLKKGNLEMVMRLNDNTASVNHETFELSSPVIMLDGNLIAPLRIICDQFGYGVRLEYYDYTEMPRLDVSRISKVYLE